MPVVEIDVDEAYAPAQRGVSVVETSLGPAATTSAEPAVATKAGDDASKAAEVLPPISYFALYRYATYWERVLLIFAATCALIHGASWPVWSPVLRTGHQQV
eukprot:m.203566 g.203566  ORF g.203566 m.203566 type:complete len:102 (-) comp15520_c2_seq7:3773-4078(-)